MNLTFIKLLREHRKVFAAMPYIYPNGDILYYVKVPSEEYEYNKIAYDVFFLIKYDKREGRANRDMQLYSNSPSFIFTYCYVYNQAGMIIDKLKDKLPIEALTQFPEIRNPVGSFGYEKSTYIAARYLLEGGCLNDTYVNKYGRSMNERVESEVFRKIADPELLISIYQHAEYNKRKTHIKELTANEKAKRDKRNEEYARDQKKIFPRKTLSKSSTPKSKITARKAQKSLMNDNKKNKK